MIDLIPFDTSKAAHLGFVYDSFRKSTRYWPWNAVPSAMLMDELKRELAAPGTDVRIATAVDMPDAFLGWAAVRAPDTVVYAFTKFAARRMGVASTAVIRMGVDLISAPTRVVFWTPACARIHLKGGYNLFHDLTGVYDR